MARHGTINVKGYTTPRDFSGFQIPVSLQSLAIRRYCDDRGLIFNHHVNENITPDSFLVLERIVNEAHLYQAIAMCSVGLLPEKRSQRTELLERALAKDVSIHFVFEQFAINSLNDLETLDSLVALSSLVQNGCRQITYLRNMMGYT